VCFYRKRSSHTRHSFSNHGCKMKFMRSNGSQENWKNLGASIGFFAASLKD
jgi:hypothetical protein